MNKVEIQNKGMSQTISYVNGKQHVDQIKWDAEFDGKNADVSFDLMKDGKTGHFNVQLDKVALAKMLNVKTVNKPIEKRLLSTFSSTFGKSGAKSRGKRIPLEQMIIEFDEPPYSLLKKVEQNQLLLGPPFPKVSAKQEPNSRELEVPNQLSELLEQLTHISSPFANENIIVPLQKSSLKKSRTKSTFKKSRTKSKKVR
jgi:hypothetical protein